MEFFENLMYFLSEICSCIIVVANVSFDFGIISDERCQAKYLKVRVDEQELRFEKS